MSMSVPERSDALDSEQRRSQEKTDAVQVAEPFAFAHTTPSELDDRVVVRACCVIYTNPINTVFTPC